MNTQPLEDFIPESLSQPAAAPALPAARRLSPFVWVVIAGAIIVGWWGWNVARKIADPYGSAPYKGPVWEYHFVDVERPARVSAVGKTVADEAFKDAVRDAGAQGWEMVNLVPRSGGYQIVFKRPGRITGPVPEAQLELRHQRELKAIEAESQAESENFQRKLDAIKSR